MIKQLLEKKTATPLKNGYFYTLFLENMRSILNKGFILLLVFQFLGVDTYAQKLNDFEGLITIGDSIKGNVSYKYLNENGNKIKQDQFHFNSSKRINKDNFKGISIVGNYEKCFKNGEWNYSEKVLYPTGSLKLSNNHFEKNASGKEHYIEGSFSEGKAQNKWNSFRFDIKNSQVVDTTFMAGATFEGNAMSDEVISSSKEISIKGTVDENNYFSGKWEFTHHKNSKNNELKEVRDYKEGRMVNHYIEKNGKQSEIVHIGLNKSNESVSEKDMKINETYFNIIYHTYFGLKEEDQQFDDINVEVLIAESNNFLFESIHSFTSINHIDVWQLTEGSEKIELPKVKVDHYPYTAEEKNHIKEALNIAQEFEKRIEKFIKNPQVNINRYAYKELSIAYEVYKLYHKELKKLEDNLELFSLSSFEYIDRKEILPAIFPDISYPEVVSYEYKDKKAEYTPTFPENLDRERITIFKIYQHVKSIEKQLNKEFKKTDPIIEKIQQKEAISDKEQIMVMKKDSVLMLFGSENKKLNDYHKRYNTAINSYVEQYFIDYAEKPIDSRVTEIDEAIKCMDDFLNLYKVLGQLPKKTERIKEIYTRVVWNPFTFTDMEEIVKERVYNAYQNYVLEYLLDNLENNINCEKVNNASKNFNILFKRMKEIRDEDTSEQEKALKRNTDIKNIVEILEIPLL